MAWRWLVGSSSHSNKVYLKVQALPCTLDTIKANPALRQDNTRAIVVAQFHVGYTAFNNIPGPVPMYFSEEPEATNAELKKSPKFAFDCMQTLLARLVDTEQITRDQAEEFLKNPTLGKTTAPLVRTWESIQPQKDQTPKSKADKGKQVPYKRGKTDK